MKALLETGDRYFLELLSFFFLLNLISLQENRLKKQKKKIFVF